jgi:flavorubredoxin
MLAVMPVQRQCDVGLLHFEADECGSMNAWLERAPRAVPLAGRIAAMVSVNDMADRAAKAIADGELLPLGRDRLRWIDTPHVPHGWAAGMLFDEATGTLFSVDLFTQPGPGTPALTGDDIVGPSEAFRQPVDCFSHAPHTQATLARLAELQPRTLACMHGSAWQGNGSVLLLLADALRAKVPKRSPAAAASV